MNPVSEDPGTVQCALIRRSTSCDMPMYCNPPCRLQHNRYTDQEPLSALMSRLEVTPVMGERGVGSDPLLYLWDNWRRLLGPLRGRVMDFHKNLLFRGVLHDQTPQGPFDQTPQVEVNSFDQTPQVRTSS